MTMRANRGLNLGCCFFSILLLLMATTLVRAESVVQWPSLKKLDNLAEKCEALSQKKDVGALRKIASSVKDAAKIVQGEAIPKGAKEQEKLKVLQGDLNNLADSIEDPDKQDGEELAAILAALHPIVEQLMEASGMPHVHEEEKAK